MKVLFNVMLGMVLCWAATYMIYAAISAVIEAAQ